jgi:hypothetical protein
LGVRVARLSGKRTEKRAGGAILYTEQTVVTGADKGAAGLVMMNGLPVTVYFKIEGSAKIATRIEVDQTAQQG